MQKNEQKNEDIVVDEHSLQAETQVEELADTVDSEVATEDSVRLTTDEEEAQLREYELRRWEEEQERERSAKSSDTTSTVEATTDDSNEATTDDSADKPDKEKTTSKVIELINKEFETNVLNYKKLRHLIDIERVEAVQRGNRNYITDKGLEQLREYVQEELLKKKLKAEKDTFFHAEILNNPSYDDKNDVLFNGQAFTEKYVLQKHKILTATVNRHYDLTVDGSWLNVKKKYKRGLFNQALKNLNIRKYDYDKHKTIVNDEINRLVQVPNFWIEKVTERLKELLRTVGCNAKVYYILHDKDQIQKFGIKTSIGFKELEDEELEKERLAGTEIFSKMVDKELHFHFIFMFEEEVEYSTVYKAMGISSESNLVPLYNPKNYAGSFQYLVHETDKAIKDLKYNYARSELRFMKYDKRKAKIIEEFPIRDHIHEFELNYREMSDRVEYIKENVQFGVWNVNEAYAVCKVFLDERSNNKVVETQVLEKQREQYMRNEAEKIRNGKRMLKRMNIMILGESNSGKTALADNWAKMKIGKSDEHFVSTPDMDGLAKDPFGRYKGEKSAVFNEFTDMPINAFKNAFDKDNVSTVPRKGREGIPYIAEWNFFTTAVEPCDIIANMMQYQRGGKDYQNSASLNDKHKRGFDGLNDEEATRSEYVQLSRRVHILKIKGDKIEVYQFVYLESNDEKYVLRKFVNEDGSYLVNFRHVGTVDGYDIAQYPNVPHDEAQNNLNYNKRVEIARNVATKIEDLLNEKKAWGILVVNEKRDKALYDKIINDTKPAFGSAINETVLNFYESYYLEIRIPFVSWKVLHDLYSSVTFDDYKIGRPLNRGDFEREFQILIAENQNMCELTRSKLGGELMWNQTDELIRTHLTGLRFIKKHPYIHAIDENGHYPIVKRESQVNGVLNLEHIRPYDPLFPDKYPDGYKLRGTTLRDFERIYKTVYKRRREQDLTINKTEFDETVEKIRAMYEDTTENQIKNLGL